MARPFRHDFNCRLNSWRGIFEQVLLVVGDINEIGTIVTIGDQQFYTIGTEGDNVKLLSKTIITLEEPIEYVHKHNKSVVVQREIRGESGHRMQRIATVGFQGNDQRVIEGDKDGKG